MSFVSWCFLSLLAIVLTGRIALSRRKTGGLYLGLLLVASLTFYGWFFPPFLGLLLLSTAIDYSAARLMDRPAMSPKGRRRLLALSVISNLAILASFKYANFAAQTLEQTLGYFGWTHPLPRSHLGLPMGISFYTFVALGYTVDVYRGTMRAERSFLRFLLFVAFFPHLMAGPIIRAPDFIRQLYRPRRISWPAATEGAWLVVQGFFLKMVCANNLALVVDRYWTDDYLGKGSAGSLLILALLFSGQIFCDFAGYSLIARGLAYWLGFRFPINFDCPYIASSFRNFWQRWHITLSTWLRDYLYIPLGGNRTGATYRNLLITMLVAGVWHGAGFTFIVWGLLHGLALVGERMLGLDSAGPPDWRTWRSLAWAALVNAVVLAAWIFFRSSSLPQGLHFLARIAAGHTGVASNEILRGCWYLIPPLAMHLHGLTTEIGWLPTVGHRAKPVLTAVMLLLILTAYGPNHTFIYFQF